METSCSRYMCWKRAFSAEVWGGERMPYLKTQKVNTTQAHKTLPTLSRWLSAPGCAVTDVVGRQTGEQRCQHEWEPSLENTRLAKLPVKTDTGWPQTDPWSVVRDLECGSESCGNRRCLQREGRREGRSAKGRRGKLDLTSRHCHLIERQNSLIYQKLLFKSITMTLLAVRLRRSPTLGSLKKAEGRLRAVHSFIVIERDANLCMCYLLARSRQRLVQAG